MKRWSHEPAFFLYPFIKEAPYMAYVPVPKDLTKVKSKFLFGLTKRQVFCFGIGAACGLPVFFLTKSRR